MSAPDALRLLELEKFDVIISDYQMPGMDGIQFPDEVRTKYKQIQFIQFIGRGREEVVIQAINCGVDFYLQKGGESRRTVCRTLAQGEAGCLPKVGG